MSKFYRKSSWAQAKLDSIGYLDQRLINAYVSDFSQNRIWETIKKRSKLMPRSVYSLNAIGFMLHIYRKQNISVCDIGGGNGELAFLAKKVYDFIDFKWTIFETQQISKAYSEIAHDSGVSWINFDENLEHNFDAVVMSSSLHYFQDPYALLNQVTNKCKFLILLRLPLIDNFDDIPAVQIGKNSLGVKVSIPYWFLSQTKIDNYLEKVGDVILSWDQADESVMFEGNKVNMQGRLIKIELN